MTGILHVALAVACLALGAAVVLQRKGGQRHRTLGLLYSACLLLVNVSALSVYQETGQPGPFHVLAVISLATLTAGFVPAFLRRPRHAWVHLHAYFMSWSYVGLVAAGAAQLVTQFTHLPGVIAVGLPSGLIVGLGGLLIHTRVPQALRALASRTVPSNERFQPARSACG